MAYNTESFVEEFKLSLEEVNETLKAIAVATAKSSYTRKERERFAEARKLLDEGAVNTIEELQAYYQTKESPASTGDETGPRSQQETLRKFATEASHLAYDLGLTQAEIIAQVAPQVASKRLAELIDDGALELDLARQLREWRQGGKSVIDIDALVEERWTQHQLEQYPLPQSLPPSSMPSSENE